MLAYLQLIRPLNAVMAGFATFIGSLIVAKGNALSIHIGLAMLVAFLVTGAGNAINDYFDVEADRINRPNRPIPSGRIKKSHAVFFSTLLFAIGIILASFINEMTFVIALVNSVILYLYSWDLKDRLLVGNIAVSYLVGSTFLFGGAAFGNIKLPLILMLLAGLANLAREIVKTLEDVEGDRLRILKKLVGKAKEAVMRRMKEESVTRFTYNEKAMVSLAALFLLLGILISPIPYLLGILGWPYFIFLIPTDLTFAFCIFLLALKPKKKTYHAVSKFIKLGMLFGLLSFVVGALV